MAGYTAVAGKVGMRLSSALIALAIAATPALSSPTLANQAPRANANKHTWQKPKLRPKPAPDRDCTPINGRYGYYGNPWCDTGSSRPPDIEYRERHRLEAR